MNTDSLNNDSEELASNLINNAWFQSDLDYWSLQIRKNKDSSRGESLL